MLIVVPSSVITRNEVENMSAAKNWFISYKDQVPTIGLFQDSLIGAAKFTTDGVRFDKWHAMQGFAHVNTTTERNVIFDKQNYTSREVISKILPKVNLTGKKPSYYMQQYTPYISYNPQNIKVEIDRGELNKGILDKKTVGQDSSGSLFQVINNTYGPEKAMETIFSMQQCISNFQLYQGFTVGMEDINLPEYVTKNIKENIVKMLDDARDITKKYNDRKLYAPIGRTLESYYEELVVASLNPGDEFVTPILGYVDIDTNGIVELVIHGSKGKLPNIISINGAIGQQDVNGFRAPKQFGWKRTSPYFTRYDMEPEANGYISQSFREGVPSKTFIFVAQEARHGLTNNALSTSVSGEQNRTAIKNLESLLTSCTRSLNIDNKIIQIIYADTGVDPRKLVSVRFPTVLISDDEFKKSYKAELKDIPTKFRNKQVEKLLDEEFKNLESDREEYRRMFFKVENYDFKYLFTDEWNSPVNIYKIIEDVKFNNRDLLKENSLNPIQAIEQINELCRTLPYEYMNKAMLMIKAHIPEHFIKSTKMLQILIRSHLCIKKLIEDKITDSLLEIIIKDIVNIFGRSLIDYGMPMGIIAAQCVSEPLTQFVLDSKHRSGVGGGTKTNPIVRYKEILSVKPTDKMKNPSMILRVEKEFENNKAAVQEIANHIEMLRLERFISKVQIFFEKYGNPIHPAYRNERAIVRSFETRHHGIKIPGDLLNWCIRFELNKEEMIFKSMTLETIILALKKEFKELFVVYTPENSSVIIIRCYIRSSLFKKLKSSKASEDIIKIMIAYMHEIRQTVIRGVNKILAAEVIEYVRSIEEKDGSISSGKIFAIGTNGSNIDDILKIKGLDLKYCVTDSLLEINELLGIEASRESIINELKIALKDISPIHCAVYADAMCYPGIITSIEKTGLNIREPNNVLLRSSYRYPVQTLEDAAETGILNTLYGISGPLCVGRPPNIGTTYSEILVNQQFVKKHTKTLDEKLSEL